MCSFLACHTTGLSTTQIPFRGRGYTVVSLFYDQYLWPHLLYFNVFSVQIILDGWNAPEQSNECLMGNRHNCGKPCLLNPLAFEAKVLLI